MVGNNFATRSNCGLFLRGQTQVTSLYSLYISERSTLATTLVCSLALTLSASCVWNATDIICVWREHCEGAVGS